MNARIDQAAQTIFAGSPQDAGELAASMRQAAGEAKERQARHRAMLLGLRDLFATERGAQALNFLHEEARRVRANEKGLLGKGDPHQIALASAYTQGVEHVIDVIAMALKMETTDG